MCYGAADSGMSLRRKILQLRRDGGGMPWSRKTLVLRLRQLSDRNILHTNCQPSQEFDGRAPAGVSQLRLRKILCVIAFGPYTPIKVVIFKIGRNMQITIPPIMMPKKAIMSGSIRLVRPLTAASTCSS